MTGKTAIDNSDLRRAAVKAITDYMHHELFEITGDTKMLPFFEKQSDSLMSSIDGVIKEIKSHPLGELVKNLRGEIMSEKNSAFPTNQTLNGGLTVRQYFAGQVIAGWFANPQTGMSEAGKDDTRAKRAFEVADAMIRASKL